MHETNHLLSVATGTLLEPAFHREDFVGKGIGIVSEPLRLLLLLLHLHRVVFAVCGELLPQFLEFFGQALVLANESLTITASKDVSFSYA